MAKSLRVFQTTSQTPKEVRLAHCPPVRAPFQPACRYVPVTNIGDSSQTVRALQNHPLPYVPCPTWVISGLSLPYNSLFIRIILLKNLITAFHERPLCVVISTRRPAESTGQSGPIQG